MTLSAFVVFFGLFGFILVFFNFLGFLYDDESSHFLSFTSLLLYAHITFFQLIPNGIQKGPFCLLLQLPLSLRFLLS
ncbi:hypothetical protein BDP55DRAFT_247009 [Colletotrichum godetiae]|uniref:Uncharacterized protein n=1 Tax=Colletotrichum godetiae TaxID=1209918 RepID=A0AAJ0AEU1_9PEZI|nr:uncharacterized protein BDP55DRAFT_247009 [Colletotrichum godetiae]KAK1672555.1 hypothetical protein BDP55DRAFT_247009 [Colletotrichum godetiae]